MSIERFPVGLTIDVDFPNFQVKLTLQSTTKLTYHFTQWPFARTESVDINVVPLGNGLFVVSWQEQDGATVTQVQDHDRGLIHSHATLPDGRFIRMTGTFKVTRPADRPVDERPHRNKALVLVAMTSLSATRRFSGGAPLHVRLLPAQPSHPAWPRGAASAGRRAHAGRLV
jgi:hypothetical protein